MKSILGVLCLLACGGSGSKDARCQSVEEQSLRITELMVNPEGNDTGREWIEFFNAKDASLALGGLTLYLQSPAGTKTHVMGDVEIAAQGYLVVGDDRNAELPSWLGYSYKTALGSLPSEGGTVGLRCGTTTIDEVTWTGRAPSGRTFMRQGEFDVERPTEWCLSPAVDPPGAEGAGSPGRANPPCPQLAIAADGGTPSVADAGSETVDAGLGPVGCIDQQTEQWRPIRRPQFGDIVISEIMANPKIVDDRKGEWIEVFTPSDIDLNELQLITTKKTMTINAQHCLAVAAHTYGLIGRSSDPQVNGGLPEVLATFSIDLSNTGDQQIAIAYADGGILSAVEYTNAPSGISLQRDVTTMVDGINEAIPRWCATPEKSLESSNGDGGVTADLATPGLENAVCP